MKSGYKRRFGSVAIFTVALWLSLAALTALAQQVVDKSIATVNDGVRTELITLSDLRWQLALQPNTPIDPPSSQDLNQALQTLINQRLFALEAERLPRTAPTDAEINAEIANILSHFPSTAEFEKRLNTVGFSSVKDPNFERIVADRVAIEKYLDFRFRSFIVITPDDEAKYYRDVFVPEFRRKYPGSLMPTLDEKRAEINKILTENKVAADIETFLDEAKRRAEIVVLNEV
ncbi:MAG TPA: hypothetical protein VL327_01095 [Pyrinomonadaceae bacterium]|jgi:hypothetical protein|nr:hypothetical protein [Pyrinomonadaceae bacterium]